MIFTIAMRNAGLLKINLSIHCLENEMAAVDQNIGKTAVNCWHVQDMQVHLQSLKKSKLILRVSYASSSAFLKLIFQSPYSSYVDVIN